MHQNNQNDFMGNFQAMQGWSIAVVRGIALTAVAFTRKLGTIGRNAYGPIEHLIAFGAMALWIVLSGHNASVYVTRPDPGLFEMAVFFVAWGFWGGLHAIVRYWREQRGEIESSRYTGTPIIGWRGMDERRIKQGIEPGLVMLAGGMLCVAEVLVLGLWLVIAGVCMAIEQEMMRRAQRKRGQALWDAMMEHEYMMDDLRSLGRRW